MELLKQLESRVQALVQQRNQLKEELDALKAAGDQELQSLRARLEEAQAERITLQKEREAVKDQVAAILRSLEALG
jgi:FtsZ-binding cell division protein ZapB